MAFIAIARIQNSCSPNVNDLTNGSVSSMNSFTTEFTCRCHAETSEILFVDQRCTSIIGYKSQELLHKNLFDQIHHDDQLKFQELFKQTVTQKNLSSTSTNLTHIVLRFRTNLDNDYVSLKTSTYAFCNPCTDDIEFIIVTFLSTQATSNKTSVIANANDYNRPAYDSYARSSAIVSTAAGRYPTQTSTAAYSSNAADDRTYANNNGGGSAWPAGNENWAAAGSSATTYLDTQASLYHQYHQ